MLSLARYCGRRTLVGRCSHQNSRVKVRLDTLSSGRHLHTTEPLLGLRYSPISPFHENSISFQQRGFHSNNMLQNGVPSAVPMQQLSESFLDGTSGIYVEEMYRAWQHDPSSVHISWATYFGNVDKGNEPGTAFTPPPTSGSAGISVGMDGRAMTDSMKILLLIRSYQVRGHVLAKLDPLKMTSNPTPPELELSTYGWTEKDLDREFYLGDLAGSGLLSGFINEKPTIRLRDLLNRLQETYCGPIGVEFMHIQDRTRCNWIREKMETPIQFAFNTADKLECLDKLIWASSFERFLALKWSGSKRFGIEGCESLIPGISALIDRGAELGVESIVMGMPHRGRLNVLANVVKKPLESIFHEFAGGRTTADDFYTGSGDVKYHLGTSYNDVTRCGKTVHISLLANPSHLEAVNPVVEGKVRAKQHFMNDSQREKVMSVLLHGDASFAAQGIVYETVDLSKVPNYTTGGTIHVIVNNQIGFTTDPHSSRGESIYCTDVAKGAGAPIFHVNGDDPEAVVHVMQLAVEWRQTFHKDVFVDIICYRKYGHNEGDEPRFTQPLMYKKIDAMSPILDLYSEKLVTEGTATKEQVTKMGQEVEATLQKSFEDSKDYKPKQTEWFDSVWKGFKSTRQLARIKNTGVPVENLKKVGEVLTNIPSDFKLHPQIAKIIKNRKTMIETGEKVDWGMAELLAYGTLLLEGNHVRVSGQDVERGTFSHRHGVLHDQNTNREFVPLSQLDSGPATFRITNSSLSEFGVLGFEVGYSLENPNSLVIWEAQFGDFANGAQVIFDQFIASGEAKWFRQSGLTVLLPHGYDGAGPEHSSARLERFLLLADSDADIFPTESPEKVLAHFNIQILNCSTPANFFHALRRQIHRDFRKPLIVMSPKSLLKHRQCVSSLKDFSGNGHESTFARVIGETDAELAPNSEIKKLIFCSGKVYYDLVNERETRGIKNIAIARIEQLAPFPFDLVLEEGKKYPNAEIMWVQEESKNMGAWQWIAPHLRTALKGIKGESFFPAYAGRKVSASPATGYGGQHKQEWQEFIDAALK